MKHNDQVHKMRNYVYRLNSYKAGILAGLAGGVIFAVILGTMDMLPLIAGLVGSDSAILGFIIHIIISAILGAIFVWWFGQRTNDYKPAVSYGLLYGIIWWVLGGLTIMPIVLTGGFVNPFTAGNLGSLSGHLIYGLIVGLVYVYMIDKFKSADQQTI